MTQAISCSFLLLCFCLSAPGQTLKCRYIHEYTKVESQQRSMNDASLCVESDGEYFTCYSENGFLRDSVIQAIASQGGDMYEMREQTHKYPMGIQWAILGNPSDGTFREIGKKAFMYMEGSGEYTRPLWEILPETAEICGYTCRKAVANYLGRTWIVWFTEEIPISVGPWLLWGTPGLILKAEDEQFFFTFTCEDVGWTQHNRRAQIEMRLEEEKHNPDPRYYEYNFAEMEQMYTRVKRDPDLSSEMMGGKLTSFDAQGRKVENEALPYIPLIPDEYWNN